MIISPASPRDIIPKQQKRKARPARQKQCTPPLERESLYPDEHKQMRLQMLAQCKGDVAASFEAIPLDLAAFKRVREEEMAQQAADLEESIRRTREQSKRDCGIEWPPVYADAAEAARLDHIPKHPQFYVDRMKRDMSWSPMPRTPPTPPLENDVDG